MKSALIRTILFTVVLGAARLLRAEGTAFTFQGRLTDRAQPANGAYDFRFVLYDSDTEGMPLGTNAFAGAAVSDGLYTVALDFGAEDFNGDPRWLEISVRTNGAPALTPLTPRREITPTPYALHAASAASLSGAVADAQLSPNIVRRDATNEFTGALGAALFRGDGSGLTNIPATAVIGAYSVLNVRDFGAVGDGVADDTAAIQAALDATTDPRRSGDVFFPAGRYQITAPLRIAPNDTHWILMPQWGPVRLLGSGSAASQIISRVTNGPAIDARSGAPDHFGLVGFKMERLGVIGPLNDAWQTSDRSEGLALGWANEGTFQYAGHEIMLQDCEFSGFTKAIGATNVWGFIADNCTFHSNRLHALAFNCTHSVSLRNCSVYGVALPGRLTDIAIGFFAPREAPGWWGFGDTAEMHQTQVQWARVAVYNDELHLADSGGNYQFVDLGHQLRSNWRANGATSEVWRAWAKIDGCMYCDSTLPWVTNSPAMVELDSFIAPQVIFNQLIGDVCRNVRAKVNIIGVNLVGAGTAGYLTYGTTNFDVPTIIGGSADWTALHNGTNHVTLHRWGGSANTLRGPLTLASGAFVGDGSGLTNLAARALAAGGAVTNGGSFHGNAQGLTNFTARALAAGGAMTNGGVFHGDGRGLTNLAAQTLAAAGALTNGGAFHGDGRGLTNLTGVVSAISVRDYGAVGNGVVDDTVAIQAAIHASAKPGASGDVFIPAGRYRITGTLRIPPNDLSSMQAASTGPLRLLGNGSGASVLAFAVANSAGIDFSSPTVNVHGFEIHRLGLEGPLVADWNSPNACVGVAGGIPANPIYSYQGTKFLMQSCAVIGWESGVALSNVWNATFDNCDFLSNRLHGLAFSCTHSATIRNSHISGQPFEGRLTGVGIGFFAPTESATWNFGDTAYIENSRVDWCTNAIWNNELALAEIGGNHQYCGKFLVSLSGTRAVDGGLWRPYNVIVNTMYCDSPLPWVTNGPACVELDSYNAERFTWIQAIGDVCALARPLFNVQGTTNGGSQYLNYYPPTALGGAVPQAGRFNGTNRVTIQPLKSFAPTLNGPVTITNANQYLPALVILGGGQGSSRAPALAIGGDRDANALSADTEHVGAWHGYTHANGNWGIPDLEVLSYRAAEGASYIGLGGTPGLLATPGKGAQEIHFYTSPKPNSSPTLAGGVNRQGGVTIGAAWDEAVANGEVSARSGFVSYRTNAWTAGTLGANGFAFWNSNGTIYCSVRVGGSITNKLIAP